MADDEGTARETIAAWVLRAERGVLDIGPMLERHGQVYRYPLGSDDPVDQVAPGHRCFLVRTDPAHVIGLWAIGEIVAPPLDLAPGTDPLPGEVALVPTPDAGERRRYAEVELLPLAKPVPLPTLLADTTIAAAGLADHLAEDPRCRSIAALPVEAARRVEGLEFWLEPPDEDERRALDLLLAAEDDLLG